MINIKQSLRGLQEELVALRRQLHRIPEPGFHEQKTSALLMEYLRDAGIEHIQRMAKTGISACVQGASQGKTLLVRADMDALRLDEKNDVPYRSTHPYLMHACGHDGHMAVLLVLAKVFASPHGRASFKGNIKFVFQPAEEYPGGALRMIEEGVLSGPDVDAALGFHLWNYLPLGKAALRKGLLMAAINHCRIRVIGKSVHGAMPQDGVDPIVVSSHIIQALGSMLTRQISALEPCVLSFGKIQGGSSYNVLAPDVELEGTVRTLNDALNQKMPSMMEHVIEKVCASMHADYVFEYRFLYPSLSNDAGMTTLVRTAARQSLGEENLLEAQATMGGEDFSFFAQKVPSCYFLIGSSYEEKGRRHPHHSDRFDFDERALPIAAEVLGRAVMQYLR